MDREADGQISDSGSGGGKAHPNETESTSRSAREKARKWMPENRGRRWLFLIVLIIIGIGAWEAWRYFSVRESTDDAKIDGYIIPVSARVMGTVLAVNVQDFQYVKAGTVLVQLDPTDYRMALTRAQADLAAAQANASAAQTSVPVEKVSSSSQVNAAEASLQKAQAGVEAARTQAESAQASLIAAKAHLREADAVYVKAEQDVARYKSLVAKDEISQQEYDAAIAAVKAAQAVHDRVAAMVNEAERAVATANARLEEAQATVPREKAGVQAAQTAPQRVSISRAQAEAALARVLQAKAAVEQAQLNVQYTSIVAMADGVVSNRTIQIGQVVQPGEIMLSIAPIEALWVTANFKETQLNRIRPGQRAFISVDALGGKDFRGHVESIAGATSESFSLLPSENATGNFVKVVQRMPVKILFEKGQDPEHRLRVGMSVEPTILTD